MNRGQVCAYKSNKTWFTIKVPSVQHTTLKEGIDSYHSIQPQWVTSVSLLIVKPPCLWRWGGGWRESADKTVKMKSTWEREEEDVWDVWQNKKGHIKAKQETCSFFSKARPYKVCMDVKYKLSHLQNNNDLSWCAQWMVLVFTWLISSKNIDIVNKCNQINGKQANKTDIGFQLFNFGGEIF